MTEHSMTDDVERAGGDWREALGLCLTIIRDERQGLLDTEADRKDFENEYILRRYDEAISVAAAALSAQVSTRAEVVEECARVAIEAARDAGANSRADDLPEFAQKQWRCRQTEATEIAAAIRSLAPSHKENDK